MSMVKTVSLRSIDIENLEKIKKEHDLGLTGVLRQGIVWVMTKNDIQAIHDAQKKENELLVQKIQKLGRRLLELEEKL